MTATNHGHTPGPWRWFGNKHGFYLATVRGGRVYVMDFVRMGMNGAQPRFQVREGCNGVMTEASELCVFEVAPSVKGMEAAKQKGSGVYRTDILEFDHPDARLIAAAPQLLEALADAAHRIRWLMQFANVDKEPIDRELAKWDELVQGSAR